MAYSNEVEFRVTLNCRLDSVPITKKEIDFNIYIKVYRMILK